MFCVEDMLASEASSISSTSSDEMKMRIDFKKVNVLVDG
jgi:hypothetical protein